MSNHTYVGGGVYRSASKPKAYTGPAIKKEEDKKPSTVLGVEVDELTHNRYKTRTWDINGNQYSLLGVMLWATSKEIATAYPEDGKAARETYMSILDELEAVNPAGVAKARRKLDNTAIQITGERMMKPMKHNNFGGYLEDIDAIYKADRSQREKIDAGFKQIEAECEAVMGAHPGIDNPERLIAQGNLLAAKKKYKADVEELKNKHLASVKAVRQEMVEHLTDFYRADPGMLDEKAIQFINSGIATPAELAHLAGQFRGNPTMLRMIGQHAKTLKEKYKNYTTGAGRDNYMICVQLSSEAARVAADVNTKDELNLFDGLAALAERGVCRQEFQHGGFEKTWAKFYAGHVEAMRNVDRLAE